MKNILISGASFAGLCTAYWMNRLGHRVTIVEIAPNLKTGGTPVNILGDTISIVKRMGLLDQIIAHQLKMRSISFKNTLDETVRTDHRQDQQEPEYEIERDFLLEMLYGLVKDKVKIIFNDRITALNQAADFVEVRFKNIPAETFDWVFGCDGIHSIVRKLCFGQETDYSLFLEAYFSISIVNKLLIPDFTTQLYSEPGRTILLNAYNGKTDICLCYASANEVPYDYRNEQQMRKMITDHFRDTGWRAAELLDEVGRSASFYFDKLCQIKMPSWANGRVALVGDAGYCPSPAAGRGGSIAIDGAAALADAFLQYPDDFEQAFRHYDASFRPFIEEIQATVTDFGLESLIPKTQAAIERRNKEGFGG